MVSFGAKRRWQAGQSSIDIGCGLGVGAIILLVVLWFGAMLTFDWRHGVGGFGSTKHVEFTVSRFVVDRSSDASHYMVYTTDGRVFEVDNGWMLGVGNADVLYGRMKDNGTYCATTKGETVVGRYPAVLWNLVQEYPYIVDVQSKQEGQTCE